MEPPIQQQGASSSFVGKREFEIIDALPDGVITVDMAGNLIEWNTSAIRMHGYTTLEEVRRHISSFSVNFTLSPTAGGPPLPIKQWPVSRALRGELFSDFELRVQRHDKPMDRVLSYGASRLRTMLDGRSIERIVLTLRDVTARHHAEQDRARLAAIVANSDDAIVGTTLDGIVTNWNSSATRLYGYEASEMIGNAIAQLVPPNRLDEQQRLLDRVRAGQAVEHLTNGRIRRDGSSIDVALTISPVRDVGGQIIGVSEIARDVTSELQAAAALRSSEERFRLLAEAMPQIVYTSAADGQVRYVNQRWRETTGLERADGDALLEVVHPDDLPMLGAAWVVALTNGDPYQAEFRLRHKNDVGYRSFLTRSLPIRDASGKITEWFGTSTDIEDLKRAESVARERQAELAHLERVRTMGQMAAGLAHELNQPLGAIANFARAGQLSIDSGTANPAFVTEIFNEIKREALRAGDIVHRLRAFVRKQEPRAGPVDINSLVTDTLRLLAYDLRTAGVKPTVSLGVGLPQVQADAVQIGQVLVNLVRNALDAMGAVTPGSRGLSVRTHALPEGLIAVEVGDRGVGIEADDLPKIFDAFYTTKPDGLGIGLALCRTIVEDHRGKLSAERNPNGGMTFVFTLRPAL